MSKTAQESFTEKAHLIFEYDPQSPLFVRTAKKEIEDQNLDAALQILNIGLLRYPNHPVAIILIGEILALQGKYSEALQYYRNASELIDDPGTFQFYQNKLLEIKKLHSPFAMRKQTSFIEAPPAPKKEIFTKEAEQTFTFEDTLPDLAEQLSHSKLNLSPTIEQPAQAQTNESAGEPYPILSETLARIHASQGNFEAAINIYQALLNRNPEKRDIFLKAIADLQKKMPGN